MEDQNFFKDESPSYLKTMEGQTSMKQEIPASSKSFGGQTLLNEESPTSSNSMRNQSPLKDESPTSSLVCQRSPKKIHPIRKERLEDVFQDEIIKAFVMMTEFKKFARSKDGLCLDESEIQQKVENNADSLEDQKIVILNHWREKLGEEATASKIRSLVAGYKRGDKSDNYISLCKNMFGIFTNETLSKSGQVFLGEQLSELLGHRLRAIKLFPYDENNLREAKILTNLGTHENVVSTIHADIYHAAPFNYIIIVMDLFWTKHLRDVFNECKNLSIGLDEQTAIDLAMQILKAVNFIHEHNVLHRDLKPENALVSPDLKHLKLTDFGISKVMTDASETRQTNANTGTAGYRARETYDENNKISEKADIFSAGVTLAEIFSDGMHPYGDNQNFWSYNIINNRNLDLSRLVISEKIQIEKLLRWMLRPDPVDRPSAEKVLNHLMKFHSLLEIDPKDAPSLDSMARKSSDVLDSHDDQSDDNETSIEELHDNTPYLMQDQLSTDSSLEESQKVKSPLGVIRKLFKTEKKMKPSMLESSWKTALKNEFDKPYFKQLNSFMKIERKHYTVHPSHDEVFAWSQYCSIQDVKVVIVGEEPNCEPGLAHGLSFSVKYPNPPSSSLNVIFTELECDIPGLERPRHGDLTGWAKQGVLLLNSVLTVRKGSPGSHSNKGWEEFTDAVIRYISGNCPGVVFMLWGNENQEKADLICTEPHCSRFEGTVECSHPYRKTTKCLRSHCLPDHEFSFPTEPNHVLTACDPEYYSAEQDNYSFLGCKHFSQANEILICQKKQINWSKFDSGTEF